ncbi:MAG: hypothetical protein WDN04_00610 [Rhodospirillales bacterium]
MKTQTAGRLPSSRLKALTWPVSWANQLALWASTSAPTLFGASGTAIAGAGLGGAAALVAFTIACSVAVNAARFCGSFSTSSTDCASAGLSFAAAGGAGGGDGAGGAGSCACAVVAISSSRQHRI